MTRTICSPNCLCCLVASLLAALTLNGCAPDLRTQLINTICEGTDEAAIRELIASGEHHKRVAQGDESVADRWWYPIHIAAFENNSVALHLLLEAGVDPDLQDVDGITPLIQLFRGEDGDTQACIDLLVKAGADVNLADQTQATALHKAASYHRHECLKALVDAGSQINAKDRFGNTPLHVAASAIGVVSSRTIKLLIEMGADRTAANGAGKTPRELCRENKRCDCEDLL